MTKVLRMRNAGALVAGICVGVAIGQARRCSEGTPERRQGAADVARAAPGGVGVAPDRGTASVSLATAQAWRDPSSPSYDPVQAGSYWGIDHRAMFEVEPRNEGFATPREEDLRRRYGALLDRLDLGVAIDEVECRTSICRIRLTAGRHVVDERVAGTLPWADSVSHTVIETEAGPAIEVLAAYTEETRDQATFEQLSSGLLERVEPTLVEVRDRALRGDAGIR